MPPPDTGANAAGADRRNLVIRPLRREDAQPLAALFARIASDPSAARFHPHPFNQEQAVCIARHSGRDMYLGIFHDRELVGYGMLRGWDAGYEVPSLGIYLVPGARGSGIAATAMAALHDYARHAGAKRVRLKVYPDNEIAVRLYERLGYRFMSEEAAQLVGYFDLTTK